MLIPLVKPSVLRVAGLDREAAGSPGFCFPCASPRSSKMSSRSSGLILQESYRDAGGGRGDTKKRVPLDLSRPSQEQIPFSSKYRHCKVRP